MKIKEISIRPISDIPGYKYEVNWIESDGEEWNEEVATDQALLKKIIDILDIDILGFIT